VDSLLWEDERVQSQPLDLIKRLRLYWVLCAYLFLFLPFSLVSRLFFFSFCFIQFFEIESSFHINHATVQTWLQFKIIYHLCSNWFIVEGNKKIPNPYFWFTTFSQSHIVIHTVKLKKYEGYTDLGEREIKETKWNIFWFLSLQTWIGFPQN